MSNTNEMTVEFLSLAMNESFARMVVAAFLAETNPTLEEVADIKTAVSEAVTNCIIHGYEKKQGIIRIHEMIENRRVTITVEDFGVGITDIKQAMEPLYTSKPNEDRSGMGFSFMEAFMDGLEVESTPKKGTIVKMWKEIGAGKHPFLND